MNHQTITAAGAPAAVGPYCHAKLCGDTLYCSGQLGLIPETGVLAQGVEAQAKQALDNLGAVLQAAGMTYANVVKTTVFLAPPTSPKIPRPAPASRPEPCPREGCLKLRPLR